MVGYGGDAGAVAVVHGAHENLSAAVLRQHGLLGGAWIGIVGRGKNGAGMMDRLGATTAAAEAHDVLGGAAGNDGCLCCGPVAGARSQELLFAHGARRGLQQASAAFWEGRGVFAFLTPGGIDIGGVDRNALEEVRRRAEWGWKQGDGEDKEVELWGKNNSILKRNINRKVKV